MAATQPLPTQGEFGFQLQAAPSAMPDLRDRLRALNGDTRAGFLPTTDLEKNTALVFLDYLAWSSSEATTLNAPRRESSAPGFAAAQLREIFYYHVKLHLKADRERYGAEKIPDQIYWPARKDGEEQGQRALRSKAYEMGDFLTDAIRQGQNLRTLETEFDDLDRPSLKIVEGLELGANHAALPALFRFFDQEATRRLGFSGVSSRAYNPFRTVEYGRAALQKEKNESPELENNETSRNKFIHDVYTTPEPSDAVAERIDYLGNTMTVGMVRRATYPRNKNMVQAAIEDQRKREMFWIARMREVAAHVVIRPIAREIVQQAGLGNIIR